MGSLFTKIQTVPDKIIVRGIKVKRLILFNQGAI